MSRRGGFRRVPGGEILSDNGIPFVTGNVWPAPGLQEGIFRWHQAVCSNVSGLSLRRGTRRCHDGNARARFLENYDGLEGPSLFQIGRAPIDCYAIL